MIRIIVDLTVLLSVLLAMLYGKNFTKKGKAFLFFSLYLLAVSIIQCLSYYVVRIKSEPNLFLFHYYFISQFLFLSLFYYYLIRRKWIIITIVFVLGILGYQYIDNPSLYYQYNAIGLAITQIVLVLYTIIHLYNSLSQNSDFVIVSSGLLMYLLSSIIIFASGNLVFDLNISEEVSRLLNDLNAVLYLVFQVLVLIEWWRNYRPKKVIGN